MAFTMKSRRMGYDNIANGSATGFEQVVVAGTVASSADNRGETTRLSLSQRGTSTSVLSQGALEVVIKQQTTDDNTVQETKDSSNTSHVGYTSGTSITSVLLERVG